MFRGQSGCDSSCHNHWRQDISWTVWWRHLLLGRLTKVEPRSRFPIYLLDRTHVPNLHIIMRRRLLGQMMAVTLRQLVASTSSILIWGSVCAFPSIIEISVRKFKMRLISKVLVNSVC
jgi:hypothetical protein